MRKIVVWFVIMIIVLSGCNTDKNSQAEDYDEPSVSEALSRRVDDLEQELAALAERNRELKGQLEEVQSARKEAEEKVWELTAALSDKDEILHQEALFFMDERYGEDLSLITKALISRPEVIETPGVLGGTMFFTKAYLLTDRLILASFEDGHIAGTGIYEYWVVDDQLVFRSVEEFVDGESRSSEHWDAWETSLYEATDLEEVLLLYRDDLDGAYYDGYGSRLLEHYLLMAPDTFLQTVVATNPGNRTGIIVSLIGQTALYGDHYGLTLADMKEDLEAVSGRDFVDLDQWIEMIEKDGSRK